MDSFPALNEHRNRLESHVANHNPLAVSVFFEVLRSKLDLDLARVAVALHLSALRESKKRNGNFVIASTISELKVEFELRKQVVVLASAGDHADTARRAPTESITSCDLAQQRHKPLIQPTRKLQAFRDGREFESEVLLIDLLVEGSAVIRIHLSEPKILNLGLSNVELNSIGQVGVFTAQDYLNRLILVTLKPRQLNKDTIGVHALEESACEANDPTVVVLLGGNLGHVPHDLSGDEVVSASQSA